MEPGDVEQPARPLIVALLDVLGFEQRLRTDGIRRLLQSYRELERIVRHQEGGRLVIDSIPLGPPGNHGELVCAPCMYSLDVGQALFSDTIVLWALYDSMRLKVFCETLQEFVCQVVSLGVPVRGGLSVGEALMEKSTGTYVGLPLVEAARVEKGQEWIGITFGRSFASPPFNRSFHPPTVLPFRKHVKRGNESNMTCVVLDWPRKWRETRTAPLYRQLQEMDTDRRYHRYYQVTLDFVDFSERNHNWFEKGGLVEG